MMSLCSAAWTVADDYGHGCNNDVDGRSALMVSGMVKTGSVHDEEEGVHRKQVNQIAGSSLRTRK